MRVPGVSGCDVVVFVEGEGRGCLCGGCVRVEGGGLERGRTGDDELE